MRFLRFVVREAGSPEGIQIGERMIHMTRSFQEPIQDILTSIGQDDEELLGVRAEAARLVATVLPDGRAARLLANSPVALVRIGVAHGWADAGYWEGVQNLAVDADPSVSDEALFLLDDERGA